MSQVKLTLRPPPNVDFVHGYPGIPPGSADRPQAAIKGALEVRVPQGGIKASYVRISLQKIESLPPGGPSNTFTDFIGPSPVNLWTANAGILMSQDFPFAIRVPESVPPSLALDNRAGIRYELVASVCTKGKKGFFRRRKSIVVSSMTPITIDKHELHTTWPVYNQPDSRVRAQDGVTLTVHRKQTCFGPGDRIPLAATVKSDSLNTVILRGFEVQLKETTSFTSQSKKSSAAPPMRTAVVAESKVASNLTLYGGNSHTADLACEVSSRHTNTSLGSARHIDISYVLSIKAIMDTGSNLVLELPVIISNWTRNVSVEAVRRIGPAPSLSLTPVPQGSSTHLPMQAPPPPSPLSPLSPMETLDISANAFTSGNAAGSTTPRPTLNKRFTVTNVDDVPFVDDVDSPIHTTAPTTQPTSTPSSPPPSNTLPPKTKPAKHWPTAEEEKERLFAEAQAKVKRVQGAAALSAGVATSSPGSFSPSIHASSGSGVTRNGSIPKSCWPSAEEEKQRLFEHARDAVSKVQGSASTPSVLSASPSRSDSTKPMSNAAAMYQSGLDARSKAVKDAASSSSNGASSSSKQYPTAEQEKATLRLYDQAREAVTRTQSGSPAPSSSNVNGRAGASSSWSPPRQYPTAEQEKASLRLYDQARDAVSRTQGGSSSSLSPAPISSGVPGYDPTPNYAASPPFIDAPTQLSEKERVRRAYAERDAAELQAQQRHTTPVHRNATPTPDYSAPPPSFSGSSAPITGAQILSEKEILRRKFAAEDAAQSSSNSAPSYAYTPPPPQQYTPTPPSRADSTFSVGGGSISGSGRILSAMEEKAMMRAKYEEEDRAGASASGSSAAPPPLMPRPPRDYIAQTREEEERVSRYAEAPLRSASHGSVGAGYGRPAPPLPRVNGNGQ